MRGTLIINSLGTIDKVSKAKGNKYKMVSCYVNGYVNTIMIDEKCDVSKLVIGTEQTVDIEVAFFKGVPNIKVVSIK